MLSPVESRSHDRPASGDFHCGQRCTSKLGRVGVRWTLGGIRLTCGEDASLRWCSSQWSLAALLCSAGRFGACRFGGRMHADSDIEVEIGPGTRRGEYTVRVAHAAGGGQPTGTLNLDVDELLSRRD